MCKAEMPGALRFFYCIFVRFLNSCSCIDRHKTRQLNLFYKKYFKATKTVIFAFVLKYRKNMSIRKSLYASFS